MSCDLGQAFDHRRDPDRLPVCGFKCQPRPRVYSKTSYVGPEHRAFFVDQSVCKNAHSISLLQPNTGQGEKIHDKKCRREQEIDKPLSRIECEHHDEKKDERKPGYDHRPLHMCGRSLVNTNKLAEFAFVLRAHLKIFSSIQTDA